MWKVTVDSALPVAPSGRIRFTLPVISCCSDFDLVEIGIANVDILAATGSRTVIDPPGPCSIRRIKSMYWIFVCSSLLKQAEQEQPRHSHQQQIPNACSRPKVGTWVLVWRRFGSGDSLLIELDSFGSDGYDLAVLYHARARMAWASGGHQFGGAARKRARKRGQAPSPETVFVGRLLSRRWSQSPFSTQSPFCNGRRAVRFGKSQHAGFQGSLIARCEENLTRSVRSSVRVQRGKRMIQGIDHVNLVVNECRR